jgi:hypothetical protein
MRTDIESPPPRKTLPSAHDSRHTPILPGSRRVVRVLFWGWCCLVGSCLVVPSCIAHRPDKCSESSDCTDGFCNARGFCESECTANIDCPCGSWCATSCGICIRDDLKGPATCEPSGHGLSTKDVLGVCREAIAAHVETVALAGAGGASEECKFEASAFPCSAEPVESTGGMGPGGSGSTGGTGGAGASGPGGMGGVTGGTAGQGGSL